MMPRTLARAAGLALAVSALHPATASAQLDPLLFLKTTQPNVIIAVDTSERMQRDADESYYDPGTYSRTGALWEATLGISASNATSQYRRKYVALVHKNASDKFQAARIEARGDKDAGFAAFYEPTRLAVARRAVVQAVTDNFSSARFGLVKTRQNTAQIGTLSAEGPVVITDATQQTPSDHSLGKWKMTRTTVSQSNSSINSTVAPLVAVTAANANTTVRDTLNKNLGTSGALIPAGRDEFGIVDAPIGTLLDDARAHASTLITADASAGGCRNTIVVLLAGGGEGTISPQNLQTKAATFKNIGGRRVPIYVIGLFPSAAEATQLQTIATESGGQYFEITKAMVTAALAGATTANPTPAVPEAVRAVNVAVQHAFIEATKFNTAPTAALPFGPSGEYQVTSPIIGTVNLRNATKMTAAGGTQVLPDSETYIFRGTTEIPQRSNVMVTSGFTLPGFAAKLRAFRVYKPVPDSTKPSGYKFSQDGSRLWENTQPAAGSRNIYTVLPGSSALVPFTAANLTALTPYLATSDPAGLIEYVRSLPMGAVVGSTPAFLDVPSLDPPPDADYPGFREANKDRRSLVFVGANDGMLHALDGRSGLEVWAFIPFNLLPKLKALRSGQSLDAFKYYVDSSPKISDVKVDGEWRTYLFFGQGPGGTFYNTLDVTLDDIANSVEEDSTSENALLGYFADAGAIQWKWSFPRLTSFDHTVATTVAPYGELSAANASLVEKSVGETWSDPAIGQVVNENGPYIMVVGSGYLKYSVQNAYRTGVTRAGTTFYVFDVKTGSVLGSRDVGADTNAETVDDCRSVNDCRKMKNALQMDPVATGPQDQRFITMAYIGDLDGRVWKFTFTLSGTTVSVSTPTKLYDATADYPLFASMATVNVGGANQYLFVGTGSDLLPSPDAAVKQQTSALLVLLDTGATATKKAEILLEKLDGTAGEEKVSTFPAVAGDIVFFTTTTYNVTTPCTPYSANLYAFTFVGGPAYDTNNDGKLTSSTSGGGGGKGGKSSGGGSTADSQKVFTVSGQRATAPFIVDQHLAFSTGGTIQMFGDANDYNNGVGQAGVRILSWRAVK